MKPDGGIPGRIPSVVSNEVTFGTEKALRVPPPDMRIIIPLAQQGDTNALAILTRYTQGIIRRSLSKFEVSKYGSGIVSDIAAETDEVMTRVLPRYDSNIPVTEDITPDQVVPVHAARYDSYVKKVARSRFINHLRREGRARNIQFIETPLHTNGDASSVLFETIDMGSLLTPGQLEVVNLRVSGMGREEIATTTGLRLNGVKARLFKARQALEREVLEPRGLFPVTTYGTSEVKEWELPQASFNGKMQAVKILHNWYTRQDWFDEYKRAYKDPPKKGFIRITKIGLTMQEEKFIRNNIGHPDLEVIIRNGAIYVRPDLVTILLDQSFRTKNAKQPSSPAVSPVTSTVTQEPEVIDLMAKNDMNDVLPAIVEEVTEPVPSLPFSQSRDALEIPKQKRKTRQPRLPAANVSTRESEPSSGVNQKENIADLSRQGLNHAEIADKVGLSINTVRIYLSEMRTAGFEGLSRKKTGPKVKNANRDAIILYLHGAKTPYLKIAEIADTTPKAVDRVIYKNKHKSTN
ncbi:MAG: sigma factor-like helix-turn-helix DNA-binding protein [Candidatus Levyibacteriota bacterium]